MNRQSATFGQLVGTEMIRMVVRDTDIQASATRNPPPQPARREVRNAATQQRALAFAHRAAHRFAIRNSEGVTVTR
ncbi:hypothetical protein AB0I54_35660 [Streptomyces sp. NPDC050625]|uniref:hypothetical protein n=1 Tax=Streptomyces sp. NPDC050625 TaxID=3154629 RepID=UPI0034482987